MTESASGKWELGVSEDALSVRKDVEAIKNYLGPEGVLQLKIEQARIAKSESDTFNSQLKSVLDGSYQRQVEQELAATEGELLKMIDGIGKAFQNPTARTMEDELDTEIRMLESMQPWTLSGLPEADLKALDPDRLALMRDPATGQFYSQEQWGKVIRDAKRDKNSRLVDQGAKIDPYEAAASFIFQLIDPNSADVIASVPEKLRQHKFEVYRNQKVMNFEAQQKSNMARLQFMSSKYSNLQDLYKDELRRSDNWALAIYNNEQQWKKLDYEVEQGKISDGMRMANEIIQNMRLLPPEQVRENLDRYNNLAQYVNTLEGKSILKIYSDDEVKSVYSEAKTRRTQEVIKKITDLVIPMRYKWEVLGGADQEDIKFINDTLKAYGTQYIGGVDRVLTINDLPILMAFNRNTANTETQRKKIESQESMNKDDNQTKKDIATQNNETKENIANIKGDSKTNSTIGKLEAKVANTEKALTRTKAKLDEALKAKNLGADALNNLSPYQKEKYKDLLKLRDEVKKAQEAHEKAKDELETARGAGPGDPDAEKKLLDRTLDLGSAFGVPTGLIKGAMKAGSTPPKKKGTTQLKSGSKVSF